MTLFTKTRPTSSTKTSPDASHAFFKGQDGNEHSFFTPAIQTKPAEQTADKASDQEQEQTSETAVAKDISVTASHRLYFVTAGITLFKKNLANGFSALGAAFSLGQSATESGYGDPAGLAKKIASNNYWGLKAGGKVIKYNSFDEGYKAWQTMMTARFSKAYELMKQETFAVKDMQKGLNPGKDAPYNYDPGNDSYTTYMLTTSKNVLKRMMVVIDEQIGQKKKEGHLLV